MLHPSVAKLKGGAWLTPPPASRGSCAYSSCSSEIVYVVLSEILILLQSSVPAAAAEGRTRQPASAEPHFPGAAGTSTKHTLCHHPHACSTPRKNGFPSSKHVRSATEPKPVPVGDFNPAAVTLSTGHNKHQRGGQPLPCVGQDNNVVGTRPSRRKHIRAHRRLKSEPRHKRSRSADAKKNCQDEELLGPGNNAAATDHHLCGLGTRCPAAFPNLCPYPHHFHHCFAPYGSCCSSLPLPHGLACTNCNLFSLEKVNTLYYECYVQN